MSQPLDESYFRWLYSQVDDDREPRRSKTHWNFLRPFFTKEFVWFVPNDDNRLEDGRDLRYEFVDQLNIQDAEYSWMHMGCSMLELLVALSRRLSFETDGEPSVWFWKLIENLGLDVFPDSRSRPTATIEDALDRVIWRTYEYSGHGGLFPLRNPARDQRKVELWYQLSAYVLELE
jgi:hypothetical protein